MYLTLPTYILFRTCEICTAVVARECVYHNIMLACDIFYGLQDTLVCVCTENTRVNIHNINVNKKKNNNNKSNAAKTVIKSLAGCIIIIMCVCVVRR